MKLLCALAYWSGAVIMSLCLLPFVLVAVLLGFGSWLVSRVRTPEVGAR